MDVLTYVQLHNNQSVKFFRSHSGLTYDPKKGNLVGKPHSGTAQFDLKNWAIVDIWCI